MQSIIYGKPILHNVLTLKSLIANFQIYTAAQTYSGNSDETRYEETLQAIDLIKGSMSQIDAAKTSLQTLIEQMKESYDSTKSKEEKKILLQDIEKIEEESHFNDVIKEATDLHFMLGTRLTEAISNGKMLERKLGIYGKTGPHTARSTNDIHEGPPGWDTENEASRQPSFTAPAIAPPRVSVPVFTGKEEEFPEFWAVYEHLVHNNPTLSTTEKMLLLKESLHGKSDKSIRGIQLIPQNYEWMIKTLHKKYGNKPANGARIVQQLNELPRASRTAESCEKVFDDICMLLNQMSSTGQNIRVCKDALWTEAKLSKFPKDIVEPVLLKMREHDDLTVDSILDFISGEISAKAYVQSRLRPYDPANRESAYRATQLCVICETSSHSTWQCQSKLPVSKKRDIVAQKRLCWKCHPPHSPVVISSPG
nr:Pao retrotransposon peptidase family [Haemonchus contortus]